MLDLEGLWSDSLSDNNVMSIIRRLRKMTDDDDEEEILSSFSCWLQRTSEFTKKELLSLCFSRCQGLWMFLNCSSFRRVRILLQKLRNLHTLVQWSNRKLHPSHLWHGFGIPCVVCKGSSSKVRHSCWNREHRALKQHIWLGRLVEWWGIMGLLPKHPEAQEKKRISQMWKEMSQSCQKTRLMESESERCSSVIQAMVTHLVKQHGCLWTSESSGQQCYPPPSLQALLKLVLVPHVDSLSVQTIIMYFILDMASFLQCKNDLFKSFCHAFTIPSSLSQQVKAFWMLDHGHVTASMKLLLNPRAALPRFSWQHRSIMSYLLSRREPQLALRYLHWTSPAIEGTEDVKLCTDVLLQNSCVSEAWALLKRSHTESDDMVMHFLQACNAFGLSALALKYIPAGYEAVCHNETEAHFMVKAGRPPCPLSAKLYQAQKESAVSSEELLQLVTKAVMELRHPHPNTQREVTWPQLAETKFESTETSTEALHCLTPCLSLVDTAPRIEPQDYNQPENPEHYSSCNSPAVQNRRRVSFSSVSSLSPLRRDQTFLYESTVTLQRISALLTDDQEEEEGNSQVSLSAEVFPDCHEVPVTLEGSTVPIIDHTFSSHSFWNRLYSNDCCQELPSLPEELVQVPTNELLSVKPEDFSSDIFYSSEAASDCSPQLHLKECQQQTEGLLSTNLSYASSETPYSLLTYEHQSGLIDRPIDGGSQRDFQTIPSSSQPYSTSLERYTDFTLKHTEDNRDGRQTDKEYASGRASWGKVSVRSRRKSKRVKRA